MLCTRNLANYPGLVKSWILRDNVQLSLYKKHTLQLHPKYCPFSQRQVKSLPLKKETSLQHTETIIVKNNQSICIVVEPTAKGHMYNTAPTTKSQRGKWTRGILRARWQGVWCETVSFSNVRRWIHYVSPIWLPKHKLNKDEKPSSCIWRENHKASAPHRKLQPV